MKIKFFYMMPVLVILLSDCSYSSTGRDKITAKRGYLDMSSWEAGRNKPVKLDGEWDFYWNRFLSPGDLDKNDGKITTQYIRVPRKWNGYNYNGSELGGEGFASCRLKVRIREAGRRYGLRIHGIETAYKLWVDGKLLSSGGTLGKSRDTMKPEHRHRLVFFTPEKDELLITMQISNFWNHEGGITDSIRLGTEQQIFHDWDRLIFSDVFITTLIMIMGIIHLGIYYFRRKELSSLFFGLFCIAISIRTVLLSDHIYLFFLHDLDWEMHVKLEHISLYAGLPLILTFFYQLYPGEISKKIARVSQILGIIAVLVALLLPLKQCSHLMMYYQILLMIAAVYIMSFLAIVVSNRKDGAVYVAVGALAVCISYINDILHERGLVNTGYTIMLGVLVFVMIMSFLLVRKISKSFEHVEILSDRLQKLDEVQGRLIKEYEESRYKILQERMDPHFLFNAIHTIHSVMMRDVEKAEDALIILADIYRFLMDRSFASLVLFDEEWQFVRNYLEFERIRYAETLSYEITRTGDYSAVSIPPLTIQPVIENSIKHGLRTKRGNGRILIHADIKNDIVRIEVTDDGIGIKSNDIYSRSLGNIKDRLKFYFDESDLILHEMDEGGTRAAITYNNRHVRGKKPGD